MTIRQTKMLILAAVAVISVLLLQSAVRNDEWRGFALTEAQMILPFAIAWWVLGSRKA